jgi:hypothetical protein
MKLEKNYRNDLKGAVCSTLCTVLLILVKIRSDSKSDTGEFMSLVLILVLLGSAIYMWIRGTKKYIDFAIEEKINQKRESASSPNENVSEA